jgi:hypothetical protein
MKGIRHEVWEDSEGLTMLFRADKAGNEGWLQPEKNSKLIHSFYASSHYEAMTIYYEFMDWGVYDTPYEIDKEPYPELKKP